MVDRPARLFGALTLAGALGAGLVISTPAAADATPGYDCVVDTPNPGSNLQPLQVCASFDKASYSSGDTVKLTVTVTNLGTGTAPGVSMWESAMSGTFHPTGNPVGPVIINGVGGNLPAGASVTSEIDGYAADPASGTVTFAAPVYQFVNGSGTASGDQVSITSQVTPVTGNYSAVVFADANGNGQVDQGEGVAGTTIKLTGPFDGINGDQVQSYSATSDANGVVSLTGLPAGSYQVGVTSPSGWDVQQGGYANATVSYTAGAPQQFYAWPASVPLKASMSFDQSSYHAGDTVNTTLTLTNTGTIPLSHVVAECDPPGEDGVMLSRGTGWDEFTGDDQPGLAIAAGQTITLHLSEILPVEEYGDVTGEYVGDCVFAPNPGFDLANGAEAGATATVLAPTVPTTDFVVDFVNDDPLEASFNTVPVGMNLLDPTTQDVVSGGFFGDANGATVRVAKGGVDDIELGLGEQTNWQLAPGQATTLNTDDLTAGQTVTIHVVPRNSPAPATPPATSGLRGNPKPVSPTCGKSVCLY